MTKSPHQLSEEQLQLSEEFSHYSGEYAQLNKTQAEHYNAHRPEFKSDTAVKRAFEVTDDGVRMTTLKLKLRALTMRMSSIKAHLKVLTEEAHGVY